MDKYIVNPVKIKDLHIALDLAGRLVQETIERVNMYLPRMRPLATFPNRNDSIYLPMIHSHYDFIAHKTNLHSTVQYYAYLQSFVYDFQIGLTEIACEAISGYIKSNKAEEMLVSLHRYHTVEVADALFHQNSEINPYFCFMRGHLSAYTVVNLAVTNLQLALAFDLLDRTMSTGSTVLPDHYVDSIKNQLGLA